MGKPRERRATGAQDLFRARLDQILNMKHELVRLAQAIDWPVLEERFGAVYSDGPGMPPLPTRLMSGLAILKHTFDLSDEALCERWIENPYFQYLCGEEFFQHELPFDRSSMTRWRQRMGEERITALLQESLAVAVKTGAMKPQDTRRVIVDTTVQPKNVMFPTDAKLINRARERLVRLARKAGLELRQSYVRVGKRALIMYQRYAHAKQFKRAGKALRKLKTYLGRTIRDILRQSVGDAEREALLRWPLFQASTVLEHQPRQRGRKIYSLHADEVECIGKGKAHAPYEFGVKVSVATTLKRSKGGQFALHAMALPGNPYDGHTLEKIIPAMEDTIGVEIERILADAGYRGHNAPQSHKFRVFTAGQKRRVTSAIKRQMRRRSAVEPVIGHIKSEHRMGRNYLAQAQGDAINAILAAAGYNFALLLNWLKAFLCLVITLLRNPPKQITA
jgi:transposase, IS5 family